MEQNVLYTIKMFSSLFQNPITIKIGIVEVAGYMMPDIKFLDYMEIICTT